MASHAKERLFKCPYEDCKDDFKRNDHLKRHIMKIHQVVSKNDPENPYQCYICDKEFDVQRLLLRHLRVKHDTMVINQL